MKVDLWSFYTLLYVYELKKKKKERGRVLLFSSLVLSFWQLTTCTHGRCWLLTHIHCAYVEPFCLCAASCMATMRSEWMITWPPIAGLYITNRFIIAELVERSPLLHYTTHCAYIQRTHSVCISPSKRCSRARALIKSESRLETKRNAAGTRPKTLSHERCCSLPTVTKGSKTSGGHYDGQDGQQQQETTSNNHRNRKTKEGKTKARKKSRKE